MKSRTKKANIIIFGSTGFVGRSLVKRAKTDVIETIRSGDDWKLNDFKSVPSAKDNVVIIAAGSSRFAAKNSISFDLDIVKNISNFLDRQKITFTKIVYISSLAAKIENRKNNYGNSKRRAEDYLLKTYPCVTIWRPPALFGNGMDSQSHLNWFLSRRWFFLFFSKITNAGISLLHVEDFSDRVHAGLVAQAPPQQIVYPSSLAIKFKDLAPRLVGKDQIYKLPTDFSKFSKIWSLLPFRIQPFFKSLWVDEANIDNSDFQLQLLRLKNHASRFQGIPTAEAPVIVIGASGGLGKSICNQLERNRFPFIAVDIKLDQKNSRLKYCLDFWKIDLTKEKDLSALYKNLDAINDVSWIVTSAGKGLRNELYEVKRFDRIMFWKLMLLSRLDVTAWAQERSNFQEHIGVINVSSSTSYFPLPKYLDYSIANAGVRLFGKVGSYSFPKLSLKTVVPGGMKTNLMLQYGDIEKFHSGSMEPDLVARHILTMMQKSGKKEVTVGLSAHALRILQWHPLEKINQKLINHIFERLR